MSRFVDALAQARSEIRRQQVVIGLLAGVTSFALWGWKTAPSDLTVHIPPDLSSGASLQTGSVPDTGVYTFAFYIWQQINRWQTDGGKDYPEQIRVLKNFVTPSCHEQLLADMSQREAAGELGRRTRALMEIPGLGYTAERIKPVGAKAWRVVLDTHIQETQINVPIKDTYIRYPLRVVAFDIDRERNPWGLAIDCFGGDRPERLDPKTVVDARAGGLAELRTQPVAMGGSTVSTRPTTAGAVEPAARSAEAMNAASATPPSDAQAALPIAPATLPRPRN